MQLTMWSSVSDGGPALLNVGLHSLWEPLTVLSQQVCGKRWPGLECQARDLLGWTHHHGPWMVRPFH